MKAVKDFETHQIVFNPDTPIRLDFEQCDSLYLIGTEDFIFALNSDVEKTGHNGGFLQLAYKKEGYDGHYNWLTVIGREKTGTLHVGSVIR